MKRLLAIVLLAAAGCAPGPNIDPDTQQTYLVYDWNADDAVYELHPSQIKTLADPRTISGDVARLRGGGSLQVSTSPPETEQDWEDAIRVKGDKTPSAEYFVDGDVIVPFDADTQLMVTLYHHLERADDFFVGHGVAPLGQLPTYYFTQFALFGIQLPLLTDNAAYISTLDAFLIPPTVRLVDGVPLSANRGVIVHEYSHGVFNRLVHDGAKVPPTIWDADRYADEAIEQLRSVDEGVADVFGALATGDANFIEPSISQAEFGIDRDLSIERVWDTELQDEIDGADGMNPYLLGSVIASAIWATRDFLDDEAVALNTLDALRAISTPSTDFTVAVFLNAWLDGLDGAARDDACEIFAARFLPVADALDCQQQ